MHTHLIVRKCKYICTHTLVRIHKYGRIYIYIFICIFALNCECTCTFVFICIPGTRLPLDRAMRSRCVFLYVTCLAEGTTDTAFINYNFLQRKGLG